MARKKHTARNTIFMPILTLVTIGAFCLYYLLVTYIPHLFSQPAVRLNNQYFKASPPLLISFPYLSHQAPIRPASVVGNQWDTYDTAISWLSTSAAPLTGGNIVLFGHNTKKLFGILKQLKRGDLIAVTTQERVIPYRVYETAEVRPGNITYITSGSNRLTMYTCSGPFDSRRLFVLARPLITN